MLRKRVIITILCCISSMVVIAVLILGKHLQTPRDLLSPLGESFSVLASIKKREIPRNFVIYGYLPYWNLESTQYLQLDKITDIAYFGLRINKDGTFQKLSTDGTLEPGYNKWKNSEILNNLIRKSKKNNVRVALTVISHEDDITDYFLDCNTCWKTLVNELETELRSKDLRDVNLNFEYTGYTAPYYANKYTQFTKYVNEEMDKRFGNSYVVVASFADSLQKPRVTNIQGLSRVADALFIMAYDFHRPTSENAGPVAPVGGMDISTEYDINTMIQDYLTQAPPNKLLMGIPYYGYNWVVETTTPYSKRIEGNDYIGFSQSQAYEDIMITIAENNPTVAWDELAQVPFFTYISPKTGSVRQVYFENKDSLGIKYDIVKERNFAGIGIWALGYDGPHPELWELLEEKFLN